MWKIVFQEKKRCCFISFPPSFETMLRRKVSRSTLTFDLFPHAKVSLLMLYNTIPLLQHIPMTHSSPKYLVKKSTSSGVEVNPMSTHDRVRTKPRSDMPLMWILSIGMLEMCSSLYVLHCGVGRMWVTHFLSTIGCVTLFFSNPTSIPTTIALESSATRKLSRKL